MTTPVIIALFTVALVVIGAAVLCDWRNRNRKEDATTHDDQVFQTAPYWAKTLNQKLNTLDQKTNILIAGQRRLHQHIGAEAWADEKRDTEMSAETQAAIDELKAEVAPMTDAVTAVSATVDRLLALYEEAGDDPDEIRAVTANLKAEKDRIVAAALKGTPIDPSAE